MVNIHKYNLDLILSINKEIKYNMKFNLTIHILIYCYQCFLHLKMMIQLIQVKYLYINNFINNIQNIKIIGLFRSNDNNLIKWRVILCYFHKYQIIHNKHQIILKLQN